MEELQSLLAKRRITDEVRFDHKNNRIRCYAHIINICSSHIIVSFTSTPKSYLSQLNIPLNPDYVTHDDSDSDNESSCSDDDDQDYEWELPGCYSRRGNSSLGEWIEGIKRDPLRRARRVIRLLRSSDEHRNSFQKVIRDGNKHNWFDDKVPELQLLRDVKTRWDSVYMMLRRLRQLRPVSWSRRLR